MSMRQERGGVVEVGAAGETVRGNRRCLCPFIAMTDTSAQAREEPRIISFSFIRGAPSGLSLAKDASAFKFYLQMLRVADLSEGRR